MTRVRDAPVREADALVSGNMKHDKGKYAKRLFAKMPKKCLQAIEWLAPEVVDVTLHHFLWMLEEREDRIRISGASGPTTSSSLAAESEGLSGEEQGWIARFSKERTNPF